MTQPDLQLTPLVLVVDDQENSRDILVTALRGQGWELVALASGEEALELLETREPTVCLIDVQLQGMDGYMLAARIREKLELQHVPLVFITGVATEEEKVFAGYDHGAVDYLIKPVPSHVLRCKVRALVDLSQMHRVLQRDYQRLVKINAQLVRIIGLDVEPDEADDVLRAEQYIHVDRFAAERGQMLSSAQRLVLRTRDAIRRCGSLISGLDERQYLVGEDGGEPSLLAVPYTEIIQALGGDRELTARVARRSLQSLPQLMDSLSRAVRVRDWDLLRAAAHKLRNDLAQLRQGMLSGRAARLSMVEDARAEEVWADERPILSAGCERIVVGLEGLIRACEEGES